MVAHQDSASGEKLGLNVFGLHNFNAGITRKSGFVECEDGGEAVDLHRRNQTSVMCRLTQNLSLDYERLPCGIDRRRLGQQKEHALEPLYFSRDSRWLHPQTVLFNWSRSYNPELHEILGDNMELPSLRGQSFDCGADGFTLRMVRLQGAKEGAGINEHALNPVWINALAAHGVIGENRRVWIVTVYPGIELPTPLLWVGLL